MAMTIDTVAEFWAGFDFDKAEPITLENCQKVICLRTFVNAHISFLQRNKGNRAYLPYYERLYRVTLAHMKLMA